MTAPRDEQRRSLLVASVVVSALVGSLFVFAASHPKRALDSPVERRLDVEVERILKLPSIQIDNEIDASTVKTWNENDEEAKDYETFIPSDTAVKHRVVRARRRTEVPPLLSFVPDMSVSSLGVIQGELQEYVSFDTWSDP